MGIVNNLDIINRLESVVRGYVRAFPTTFVRAKGAKLYDADGKEYIDFFAGAGVVNFGHNDDTLKEAAIEYLQSDALIHSLDMATSAKESFLGAFEEIILKPRGLNYRVQFPGPAGTTATEAAMKLARKVKQRDGLLFCTNGYHGMTLGALAVTGNATKRAGANVVAGTIPVPYCGFFGPDRNTADDLEKLLEDSSSGLGRPAAIILETVQGEGGINVATNAWLQQIEAICKRFDMLFIVDDIQAGCGRTGPFFSFEPAGIKPDMVTISKSISGYGMPLALTLIKPEYDIWSPGEHNGTFRGFTPAFVTGEVMLNKFWKDDKLEKSTIELGDHARKRLQEFVDSEPDFNAEVRGRGLFIGMDCHDGDMSLAIRKDCFAHQLICEAAGAGGTVVKLMPPLVISREDLDKGIDIIIAATRKVLHG